MAGQVGLGPGRYSGDRQREVTRVARHIRRAEWSAAQRAVSGLGPLQRAVRALLLRELRLYCAAARFPRNRLFREQTPVFVDAGGNRCAVAHLLEVGGEAALVQRIARERNHARVAELADEPRLVAWLRAAGLSLAEASMIQPSYCADNRHCVCNGRALSYLEAVVTMPPIDGVVLARVQGIHGAVDVGLEVGSDVRANSFADVGTELVLRGNHDRTLPDGSPVYRGIEFRDGKFSCAWGPQISRAQYLRAVLSNDCEGVLEDIDQDWNPDCDGDCGCRVVGASGAEPTSLGILVAVLGVVVARRMSRASPAWSASARASSRDPTGCAFGPASRR